jgi:hypothetical protein
MSIKVVKWIGFAENAGKIRSEVYDTDYGKCTPSTGNKPVRSPFRLGLLKNGKYLIQTEAFVELKKPIWGPNNNQMFEDILPFLTAPVPKYINSIDAQYEWHSFDKDNPDTYPPTEIPDNGRGWECEDSRIPGKYYQNMYWSVADANTWGDVLHIFRYRKQKLSSTEPVQIPNPEYPIVEAKRAADRALYKQILQDTFDLLATYQFPGLPCLGSWKWYEGDTPYTTVIIPQDCGHQLALLNAVGGWKMVLKPMPEADQIHHIQWDGFINNSILVVPPKYTLEYRVKRLLGM